MKIIITESQHKKLLNEELNGGEYKMRCKLELEHYGLAYKGGQIDDVTTDEIDVYFDISMDGREWGIKDVSVYNIKGPSEIGAIVTYYIENSDDSIDEDITIQLDWSNINEEKSDNLTWIGINNEIVIRLKNTENGELSAETITVETKTV